MEAVAIMTLFTGRSFRFFEIIRLVSGYPPVTLTNANAVADVRPPIYQCDNQSSLIEGSDAERVSGRG